MKRLTPRAVAHFALMDGEMVVSVKAVKRVEVMSLNINSVSSDNPKVTATMEDKLAAT